MVGPAKTTSQTTRNSGLPMCVRTQLARKRALSPAYPALSLLTVS